MTGEPGFFPAHISILVDGKDGRYGGGDLPPAVPARNQGVFPRLFLLPAVAAAVKNSDPGLVQLGFVMDPLTASVLGFFVLGQTLLPVQIAGMVLILAVVVWVQWLEVKAARLPTKTP